MDEELIVITIIRKVRFKAVGIQDSVDTVNDIFISIILKYI